MNRKKINKEQQEAINHKDGPLLIVAGAGTGKTTVISERVANLINNNFAKVDEVLALTFTEKASSEMEERIAGLLPFGYVDLWVSTFHSFAERILRENALDIGLSNDFKILDQTPAWLLIRQNLDKFDLDYYKPLGNPTKFISSLITHFSRCKDQEIYPEDYLEFIKTLKTDNDLEAQEIERLKEVANCFCTYQQILLENNYLDFGDVINYCLKLFDKRPNILKKYQEKFKYILIDEFQDTNFSQYELIKKLSFPKNNLCVCADDDQAIYRWRGACYSNILQFKNDFPNTKYVSLVQNYRSCQNILDLSYKFIQNNNPDRLEFVSKINKKLISQNKEKGIIEHLCADNSDKEVGLVVKKILEILKKDKSVSLNDFAILSRSNNALLPFIKGLERANISYQFFASKGLYSKPVILDIISYFKLLDNYHESSAVFRVLNLPFLKIDNSDISTIIEYSRKKTKSIFESLNELQLIPKISSETTKNINFLLNLINKDTELAREKNISEILISFLHNSGYIKYLVDNNLDDDLDLLDQFYKKIKNFENTNTEPILRNFMQEFNLEIESGDEGKLAFDLNSGPEMVRVMTIHGAKGLEFKYVFLVSMVDRRFPSTERKDLIELPEELLKEIKPKGDAHLQEERRICYVAMTRAKKGLYFTSAKNYGDVKDKKISRFLIEMGYKDNFDNKAIKEGNLLDKNKKQITCKQKTKQIYLPDHFSYSQLTAFEKCPLQYKFNFILKVPIRGKASNTFGRVMHNTLYEFLKLNSQFKKENKKIKILEFAEIEKIYDNNWVDEWYQTKKEKDKYYNLGKKIIKSFYDDFKENKPEIAIINNELSLELPFNLKIDNNEIHGRIDRIDKINQGIEIIDYKTGIAKEKLDLGKKEQLIIYQIALEEILNLKVEKLTFYYLEDNKKMSFLASEKDKQKLKEKIINTIAKIKTSDFKATPGWDCKYCDFKDICNWAER